MVVHVILLHIGTYLIKSLLCFKAPLCIRLRAKNRRHLAAMNGSPISKDICNCVTDICPAIFD